MALAASECNQKIRVYLNHQICPSLPWSTLLVYRSFLTLLAVRGVAKCWNLQRRPIPMAPAASQCLLSLRSRPEVSFHSYVLLFWLPLMTKRPRHLKMSRWWVLIMMLSSLSHLWNNVYERSKNFPSNVRKATSPSHGFISFYTNSSSIH